MDEPTAEEILKVRVYYLKNNKKQLEDRITLIDEQITKLTTAEQ